MNSYQKSLVEKMDKYAHFIYKVTKDFPKSELYGVVSQIRRASVSVVLNYIEGYARKKPLVRLNFLEISFGSLKESKYLLYFSFIEEYLSKENYLIGLEMAEELCAMLWKEIDNLDKVARK
ncbi:MAG: four helix bundle protein [Candidatus Falkowbacteria bacterium]